MADVIPFKCWRPRPDVAAEVAAAPYDTFSRAEAAEEVAAHPLSFLRIDKPAALYDNNTGEYDAIVYERAKAEMDAWYEQHIIMPDNELLASDTGQDSTAVHPFEPAYFVYRLTQGAHTQTGVMACASVAEYQNGGIKRHENTRALKEGDRVEHIKALNAHTGPVLLTYPSIEELSALLREVTAQSHPLYDFVAQDGVRHEFWRVDNGQTEEALRAAFSSVPTLYIADGHHRAAAAARIAELPENKDNPEAQYFLCLLVSSDEMQVLDYNRVVSDLADQSSAELLARVSVIMKVENYGTKPYKPQRRGEFGMYVDGNWYKLHLSESQRPDDAVDSLDVALLHELILEPLLDIDDPRSNPRISYVGGIRGLDELAQRADKTGGAAFALYPCSLDELFAVADADRLMPPKSTWFEPKPKSGLAIHRIDG